MVMGATPSAKSKLRIKSIGSGLVSIRTFFWGFFNNGVFDNNRTLTDLDIENISPCSNR